MRTAKLKELCYSEHLGALTVKFTPENDHFWRMLQEACGASFFIAHHDSQQFSSKSSAVKQPSGQQHSPGLRTYQMY